jgi:signal transduction histidine kinase
VQDEALREKLVADLSAMQGMVKEGLELAQSLDSGEKMQRLDLDSLLDSVCADAADAGQNVVFQGASGISLHAQPNALRRCLDNVVDNAVKYGGSAEVSASRAGTHAVIRVRDHGPGIPEAELETVFDPFYRRESSRSRETGGTGLGLTIARNIAAKHGGTLKLRNHPEGGLEAVLELAVGE